MWTLETMLKAGGYLHFAILIANALTPIVLDWRGSLSMLSKFMRQLVWAYGAFIVLVIIGFGLISVLHAHALAAGTPLARALCGFIAFFWLCRLIVQIFVFDIRPLVSNFVLKAGYHGLTAVFAYFVLVYGWAALMP